MRFSKLKKMEQKRYFHFQGSNPPRTIARSPGATRQTTMAILRLTERKRSRGAVVVVVVVVVDLNLLDLLLLRLVQDFFKVVGQGDQAHRPLLNSTE